MIQGTRVRKLFGHFWLHYSAKTFSSTGFDLELYELKYVLLVCIDTMKQESLFLPLIGNMLFVSMKKRMEMVFGRFCGFIIMFELCVIFERRKITYVG